MHDDCRSRPMRCLGPPLRHHAIQDDRAQRGDLFAQRAPSRNRSLGRAKPIMAHVQDEIELLQAEILKANEVIAASIKNRRAIAKDSPLAADAEAAVVKARQALVSVELKVRALYE